LNNPSNIEKILSNSDEILNLFGKNFSRSLLPALTSLLSITQNRTSIAIVERNSQSVHIFDKQTKEQVDEVQNLLRTEGTFRLWNVLVGARAAGTPKMIVIVCV
jgi:hypothetical protein